MGCATFIALALVVLGIEFLSIAVVVRVVCWGFGLTFTWPAVVAIFVIVCFLTAVVTNRSTD